MVGHRRTTILLTILIAAFCAGSAAAQQEAAADELIQGAVYFDSKSGDGGFGLPVAHSALGRQWAFSMDSTGWQMAPNYSTVPVRVSIHNRRPEPFRGRIEVESPYAYSAEE